MKNRWTFVDTPVKLAKAEKSIRSAPVIALDTEYDSFRYFREKLCLHQIQTDERTWLIDPLAAGLGLGGLLGPVVIWRLRRMPEALKLAGGKR